MKKTIVLSLAFAIVALAPASATIINVPDDYPDIQQGIDASVNGDTVLVTDGIYSGMGNRNIVFGGKEILLTSQNGAENTIIDCEGNPWIPYQGFIFIGENQSTILDGFTIRFGSAGPYCSSRAGGAIYCEGSPTIRNCIFFGNRAQRNNCAYSGGGAIFCLLGSPTLINCLFEDNSSDDYGGAIKCVKASPILIDCIFVNNSSPWGSALHTDDSRMIIRYCAFINNYGNFGVVFSGKSSNISITNCTFSDNISDSSGIAVLTSHDTLTVLNSIFWNALSPEIETGSYSTISVSFSDMMGGWTGPGNIDCDPLFCDHENGNYSLSAISCCVGAGNNGTNAGSFEIGCGALGGHVTNPHGNPIEGVAVNLIGSEYNTQSNSDGEYLIANISPDDYSVLFSHDDYKDTVVSDVFIQLDSVSLDVTMMESGPCSFYITGDVNGSNSYNGLDITYGVNFLKGGFPPLYECECVSGSIWFVSGDVNASCSYNGLDITYGVNYFKGGDNPVPCGDCPPVN